jgi:hypothetical protein
MKNAFILKLLSSTIARRSPVWLITLLYMVLHNTVYAQKNPNELVREVIDEIRENKYSEKRYQIYKNKHKYRYSQLRKVLEELNTFVEDSSIEVRRGVALNSYSIYKQNIGNKRLCIEATDILVKLCNDPSGLVWQYSAKLLRGFRRQDFSEPSKIIIRKLLSPGKINGWFILLAGAANLTDQIPLLQKIAGPADKQYRSNRIILSDAWDAHLALARMGDLESENYCLARINQLTDKEDIVVVHSAGIAYMRQQKSYEFLMKFLYSDERPCVGAHYDCLPLAHYILPLLADTIQGFPVVKKPYYEDDDLNTARKWLRTHPKYKIIL